MKTLQISHSRRFALFAGKNPIYMNYFTASLRLCGFICLLAAHCLPLSSSATDYTRWVNPFIGTGGHGHTFPGATVPFGMVQLSPDTRIDNWDGSSGYHYSDDTIYGFSHTHLSGTGIPDGCDILLMPSVGDAMWARGFSSKPNDGYPSKFSHLNEKAEPGYYSVRLDDDGIVAELTSTKRVGLHKYTFPKTDEANVTLDLGWRDKVIDSDFELIGKRRIEGFRRSTSWAKQQTVYFVAELSEDFDTKESTTYFKLGQIRKERTEELDGRIALRISPPPSGVVFVKVSISFVSIEGARKNLKAELPGWDFDKVRADAKAAWNKELSKIEVSGGTDEQTTNFYTALYHTMIQPNVFNDVDGQYRGHDGKVHSLCDPKADSSKLKADGCSQNKNSPKLSAVSSQPKSEHYTVFSLWDTFRAAHPLYTIIDQKRTVDFINTFIRIYEQGGRLPVWELWGEETDTMIGYHAVSVIADAMAKRIKGFDYEKAYAAAKHSAELDHFGLAGYKKRGYISMEDENESVSRTLEYAYNDWCIAQMAKVLERSKFGKVYGLSDVKEGSQYLRDRLFYEKRSRYFENLFDTKTGFFRAKKNGAFVEPFSPTEVNFGFTEGNSWQYSFFVPHDVEKLTELMGGREKFVAKLDELFTTTDKLSGREQADLTGLIGQYAHGNEPSHHIAYLYNYAQEPWKTQKYVRRIMDEFYKNAPNGLIGNEDCGQMSAWYIMSAGGFYLVAPGNGVYAFGTPLFPEMTYRLENGKRFTIRAKNVSSKNSYILNAKLNGAPYKKAYITHEDVMRGGVLEFTMIDQPVTTAFNEFPVSSVYSDTVAAPSVAFMGRGIFMQTPTTDATIYFTTDGTEPSARSNKYLTPDLAFQLAKDSRSIRAIAIDAKGNQSPVVQAAVHRKPNDWTVDVLSGYSTQYTGGGENAIVDGIRGTVNFASGEWQGVQGKLYEAVIDLQRETEVKQLGGSFLQVAGPWIWMPDRIEFEVSSDGTTFTRVAEIKPNFPQREMTPTIREFTQTISSTKARYVRIRAHNFGKIQSWHLGAGGDPWIFVDEIVIR